jgi:Rod binding domain-containing protein
MTSDAGVYTDFQGLTKLRADVRADAKSQKNLQEVASQFEALFTQLVLKNMRESKLADGIFGSEQEDQYLQMFDAQLALQLSKGTGLGLKESLIKQLSNSLGVATPTDAASAGLVMGRPFGKEGATDGLGQSPPAFIAHAEKITALLQGNKFDAAMAALKISGKEPTS